MGKEKTPEQLLSEALRAKAVQAPVHAPPPLPATEAAEQQPEQSVSKESAEDTDKTAENTKAKKNAENAVKPDDAEETPEPLNGEENEKPAGGTGPTSELSTTPISPAKHESLFADNDASFELLSGHDYHLPSMSAPTAPTSTVPRSRPFIPQALGAPWILLLAVVLGAAAGALAGLLTLR